MTNNFENHEHDNQDDFIEPEIGISDDSEKKGVAGNLAEAWRTRPMFKFMVLIVGIVSIGVAALNFFGGADHANNDMASIGVPPKMKEVPGGTVSPYMKKQTEMADKERTDQAIASGGSVMPTPMGQTANVGDFGANDKKDDPLSELRLETEKLRQQVQQQQVQQVQIQQKQQAQPPEQFDNSLAEAMQHQMQQLLEGWTPRGIKNVTVIKSDDLKDMEAKQAAANAANAGATSTAGSTATVKPKALVNAGTVSYAQLLTEANSDVPGPILAQIVSGPLAGARAVGAFQVANGYEKYLVLSFTLADKKGTDYTINAIALDPDTTLGGMATEVDERYFARVVLPAAAGFLQGMGQALGQGGNSITSTGTTTITTQASNGYKQGIYQGMGAAAQTAGQFFQNQANLTKPLVRVAAGTPLGIFFVAPVYDPSAMPTTVQTTNGGVQQNPALYGAPYGNAPYPGTTVNGYGGMNPANGVPYPNYAGQQAGYGGYGGNTGYGNTAARYGSTPGLNSSYTGYGQ